MRSLAFTFTSIFFIAFAFSQTKATAEKYNARYAAQIDSLYYVDQVIIRNRTVTEKKYKTDVYVYAKDRNHYDSVSFRYLLQLIDNYGFPSEQKIGKKVYEEAALVIHHSIRMPYFREELENFKKYVFKKEYKAEDFAWAFDQSEENLKRKPFYYYKVGDPSKLSETEKKEVNERRREIGLKDL